VPEPNEEMRGFETPDGVLPTPPVPVSGDVRDKLVHVVACMVSGATPEEITGYLEDGWPESIEDMLGHPLEAEELGDHVDLLLSTLQAPALSAA